MVWDNPPLSLLKPFKVRGEMVPRSEGWSVPPAVISYKHRKKITWLCIIIRVSLFLTVQGNLSPYNHHRSDEAEYNVQVKHDQAPEKNKNPQGCGRNKQSIE